MREVVLSIGVLRVSGAVLLVLKERFMIIDNLRSSTHCDGYRTCPPGSEGIITRQPTKSITCTSGAPSAAKDSPPTSPASVLREYMSYTEALPGLPAAAWTQRHRPYNRTAYTCTCTHGTGRMYPPLKLLSGDHPDLPLLGQWPAWQARGPATFPALPCMTGVGFSGSSTSTSSVAEPRGASGAPHIFADDAAPGLTTSNTRTAGLWVPSSSVWVSCCSGSPEASSFLQACMRVHGVSSGPH